MKKRKTYEISVIDKTYSKIITDKTMFYTSDTALELGFELKETEYTFESAEIVLLNIDDRSLVTRPVAKVLNSFAYELDDDITAHYGDWRGQLRFEQAGEIYVSSPVKFRIENDLSNDRPPQLSDVQSWVSLKRYADGLIEELKQAVLSVEGIEDAFNVNELERQNQFASAEQSRQTTFATNEANRTETFNANEVTRQVNETTRQQAESQRQSTFETNENERQTTFETAEQERQSAELMRVENENQRNLTSVDEFVKLQDSVGGRNLAKSVNVVTNSDRDVRIKTNQIDWFKENIGEEVTLSFKVRGTTGERVAVYPYQNASGLTLKFNVTTINLSEDYTNHYIHAVIENNEIPTGYTKGEVIFLGVNNAPFDAIEIKIEKGAQATPYTQSPEDYTVVSKEDYYNHVKIMNNFKDGQFNKLKQAVIALGGTV